MRDKLKTATILLAVCFLALASPVCAQDSFREVHSKHNGIYFTPPDSRGNIDEYVGDPMPFYDSKGKLFRIFYLRDQLLIGTGKQCNVVIRDSAAAPVNTRIFTQDQMVYIEDMGSPLGTALNGMRLFTPNRLRSEDEITVGNTVLRVLF